MCHCFWCLSPGFSWHFTLQVSQTGAQVSLSVIMMLISTEIVTKPMHISGLFLYFCNVFLNLSEFKSLVAGSPHGIDHY